ncbi:hypothetical protein [Cohnella abietis]|uniref:Uncharacterized protein n=1 Tax=Cohnella abietis TaxID=2507935 RepID=A0A3T1CZ64_9BACL|nr:hypothetical protein [Cohnella abietis]BBI31045.1 hypothetical protein KCTCHS21_04440 [Cohnella abietis]
MVKTGVCSLSEISSGRFAQETILGELQAAASVLNAQEPSFRGLQAAGSVLIAQEPGLGEL